jgi:RNA polymerase sigma-70 factor (ECF subfamily)
MVDESGALDRARKGDLDAFNDLVVEHQDAVFRVCLRMLGSYEAAQDAAQQAFISAWRALPTMRGDRFRAWLLRIASNSCLDELRRQGRRPGASLDLSLEGGMPEPETHQAGPEAVALSRELRAEIDAALQLLPDDQRLAVILCDIEELEYEEIGRVMGTSIGTVKSRISRGRARLRQLLLARPELLPEGFRQSDRGL